MEILKKAVGEYQEYVGERIVRQLSKDSAELEADGLMARFEGSLEADALKARKARMPRTERELRQEDLAKRGQAPRSISTNMGFGDMLVARDAGTANELRSLSGFQTKAGGIDPRIQRLVI